MSRAWFAHYEKDMHKTERDRIVQVRVSEDELAKLHRLAEDGDESVSRMLRRLVREEAERRESATKARKETTR
jgi:hypothetical protein